MTLLVVDASTFVQFLLDPSEWLVATLGGETSLHTAVHCDVEVLQTLRKLVSVGALKGPRAAAALESYAEIPVRRHGCGPHLRRVFSLRHNFSAYDAAYVAVAEALGATLLTGDARLARAVREHLPLHVTET